MDFKNIDKNYRPIPFWSWNERLDADETRRQVRLMDESGIGGYFMHARGGLLTEYMGDEWFENVYAACDEGEKRNMRSWAYDENGWPSGFGDGRLLTLGEDYLMKNLVYKRTEDFDGDRARVVLEKDGYTYYYDVNELYVDLLNPKVTERFIHEIYDTYAEKCGQKIEGFFTDEPQLIRYPGFPWSVITVPEFKERYGYDLIPNIPSLFFEVGDYNKVRFDYWKMTTEQFSENYFKQIYDWCEAHGYKLTGHLVGEEVMDFIIPTNGACMPHYEYFQIPGMDWLGRPIADWNTPRALGSVAAQLGKKQVLSETFALTGHNVSHGELKRIYEWQMVRGINLLCTHLEGYSNRGIRKRDYPAAIYYQQPWWDDVKVFFDTVSRIGMILGEGKHMSDTLVIHPMSTAWCMYNGYVENRDRVKDIRAFDERFTALTRALEDKHILFDLGDEIIMERHGRVEDGCLVIGQMKYKRVIIPEHTVFFENTERLIEEFRNAGGEITTVEDIPANPITEVNRLTYMMRKHDDFTVHYFVNSDPTEITATIKSGNLVLDPATGETSPFSGKHTFGPYESLMLIDDGGKQVPSEEKSESRLSLLGEWELEGASYNSITLDRCDYYLDGELIAEGGYVLDILPRVNAKRRPVNVRQIYRFMVEEMPEGEIYLTTETPEIFDIKVNGHTLKKCDAGDFRDISFRRLPMRELVVVGENVIELECNICQSKKILDHIDNSWVCETMTNCLSYDIEIEPIYIVGDFGVKITGEITELERGAYRVKDNVPTGGHSFAITRAPKTVVAEKLDLSGYPQFAGTLTLKRTVNIADTNTRVTLTGRGLNSIHLSVNGREVGVRMFGPYDVSLSDHLVPGENEIKLTVVNNLRNMQGPTHLKVGESYVVGREAFYRESNVFRHAPGADDTCHDVLPQWDDDVCLVHYGITDGVAPITEE